jgi:4-amino-4-deoxy-L-arabinose transferase-like glycosyltransferase
LGVELTVIGVAMRSSRLIWLLVAAGSIALGFALTAGGVATWDSLSHFDRSRWLLHMYGLPTSRTVNDLPETMKWYGPLWAMFLGLASELAFAFVRDPTWVEQAFNFALFPVGLYAVARLLVRAGIRRSTAALAVALLFGAIRLGGHALVNVNDFPMAMLSLLAMLYLWTKLRQVDPTARADGRFPRPTLAWLGVVAIVPFLIRPPVALQLATLTAFFALYGATALRGARRARRVELLLVPVCVAVAFTIAVWPTLWEPGRRYRIWEGLTVFARFPWVDTIRYFGRGSMSNALPRWYPFIWLPVMLSPATFLLLLVGLARGATRRSLAPQSFLLPTAWGTIDLSLRRWLAIHVALLWLAVIVLHPTLYDEERHLLFLYPPLLVLAALGLDDLGERLKVGLTVVVVATSLSSYAHWGRYAYVYKSSLIGARGAHRFMGDYWGVCVPLAVDALAGRVPAGAQVLVPGPFDPALIQYQRRREGPRAWPGFGPYQFLREPAGWPAYLILNNRNGRSDPGLRAVQEGRSRELWRAVMPPGDPACVLVEYFGSRR